MNKKLFYFFLIISLGFLLCLILCCQKKAEKPKAKEATPVIDIQAENTAIRSVFNQVVQAYKSLDLGSLSKLFAQDEDLVVIGTSAAEQFFGFESWRKATKQGFEVIKVYDISLRDVAVKIHKSGEVARVSLLCDFVGTVRDQLSIQPGIRVTGVLEKRNGSWVIVQWHASIPMAGEKRNQ